MYKINSIINNYTISVFPNRTYTLGLFATSLLLLFAGCDEKTEKINNELYPAKLYDEIQYDLSKPDTTFLMPRDLTEISGLTNFNDQYLLAVQDENGIVFQVNTQTGQVDRKVYFGKNGDFEGIEYVDPIVYIAKSNGDLYWFEYPLSKNKVKSDRIKTALKRQNDIEGLGFHSSDSSLVLMCKGGSAKSIYFFNPRTTTLDSEPVLSISVDQIRDFVTKNNIQTVRKVKFKPSGIAVHPITGEIFILAHTGKALLILDKQLEISSFVQLNPFRFQQPEGICFTSDGTLYISNEGKIRNGNILKFSMR